MKIVRRHGGWVVVATTLVWLAVGCSDDDKPVVDLGISADGPQAHDVGLDATGGPDGPTPDAYVQPLSPAKCGMKSYDWLAPGGMGKVVSSEKSSIFSLSAAALDMLLKASGYNAGVTAKYDIEVHFYRYTSQDRGKKVEATAAMAFPKATAGKPLGNRPLVLWEHGTSGWSDNCAPTRKAADAALPVALLASQGYIGVAPDFLGMNGFGEASTMGHPYLVSEPTAIASLDAARAAARLVLDKAKNILPSKDLIVWGPSQGGHATLATLLYAPYYAPEFNLLAGMAIIVPADIKAQAGHAITHFGGATGLMAAMAVAYHRWYGYSGKLSEVIADTAPANAASKLPALMDKECGVSLKKNNITKVSDLFVPAFVSDATTNDWKGYASWRCFFAENSLTSTSIKRTNDPPILYVLGEKDELVAPAVARKSFTTLCGKGYDLQYLECKGANHVKAGVWSMPEQFAWLADRVAKKPLGATCKQAAAVCCSGSDTKVCTPKK